LRNETRDGTHGQRYGLLAGFGWYLQHGNQVVRVLRFVLALPFAITQSRRWGKTRVFWCRGRASSNTPIVLVELNRVYGNFDADSNGCYLVPLRTQLLLGPSRGRTQPPIFCFKPSPRHSCVATRGLCRPQNGPVAFPASPDLSGAEPPHGCLSCFCPASCCCFNIITVSVGIVSDNRRSILLASSASRTDLVN